jgi:hypothetical protein
MNQLLFMKHSPLRWVATLSLLLIAIGCGSSEPDVPEVTDLVVTIDVDDQGSGQILIDAKAKNVKFFKFYLGEDPLETPIQTDIGLVVHTYKVTGNYTVKVQAHSNESQFLTYEETIEVKIFTPIPQTGYTTPSTYAGMNLLWQEEFNDATIDETKWTFEIGNNNGWGNNELEYYRKENASIVDGHLMIEAKAEPFGGKSYTSTRMITKGKFDFKYGRVDVRAALPEGKGVWPAIWMLGANIDAVSWPKCGEIDIMEKIGGGIEEKKIYGTVHWFASAYANYGGSFTGSTEGIFNDKFHVYSITWDAEFIRWYIDDSKFHEIDIRPDHLSEFRENFFLILNVAVGGNWPGNPDANTQFPQRMFVDYIRVFQPQ